MSKKHKQSNGEANVKTFYFSNDELSYLIPRQEILMKAQITASEFNAIIRTFVISVVLPRVGVDPEKEQVNFDIFNKTIKVSPRIVTATDIPKEVKESPITPK